MKFIYHLDRLKGLLGFDDLDLIIPLAFMLRGYIVFVFPFIRRLFGNYCDSHHFSKRLNIIQNNLHSHQVLHIWVLGLNYLTAVFNGYEPVAF